MSDSEKADVKAQVRALLDRLPDDCSFADIQRAHRRADVAQAATTAAWSRPSAWRRTK